MTEYYYQRMVDKQKRVVDAVIGLRLNYIEEDCIHQDDNHYGFGFMMGDNITQFGGKQIQQRRGYKMMYCHGISLHKMGSKDRAFRVFSHLVTIDSNAILTSRYIADDWKAIILHKIQQQQNNNNNNSYKKYDYKKGQVEIGVLSYKKNNLVVEAIRKHFKYEKQQNMKFYTKCSSTLIICCTNILNLSVLKNDDSDRKG